jgi:phosphoglycerate dehydrogenase-like enzyme
LGIARAARLQGLLLKADIVSLHEPEGPGLAEGRRRLGLADLAVLPQGALVVDITGGAMLDRAALAGMLEAGHLGGAALDLPAGEAAPPGVLVTRSAPTDAALEALRRLTAEAILSAP